jgi:hypothetical protein
MLPRSPAIPTANLVKVRKVVAVASEKRSAMDALADDRHAYVDATV